MMQEPHSNGIPGHQQPDNAQPQASTEQAAAIASAEIGGRDGPEPTRFGDWEKNGRCIDF